MVWLAILQATFAVSASYLLGGRAYRLGFDLAFLQRLFVFGWPIWLSAIPLVAIYQGDLLDGCYDAWALQAQGMYRERYVDALTLWSEALRPFSTARWLRRA